MKERPIKQTPEDELPAHLYEALYNEGMLESQEDDEYEDWFEDDEYDKQERLQDAMENCGQDDDGYCTLAGSEYCDFECPFRD